MSTASGPAAYCSAASPCTSGSSRNAIPSRIERRMSRGRHVGDLRLDAAIEVAQPHLARALHGQRQPRPAVQVGQRRARPAAGQRHFGGPHDAPGGIVAALRVVHQHAGGEIDPAQDLAQLVDLALLAELGDGAEDVREGAPLHLGQHVAADLQRVPAQRPHPAGRELADLHVPRQAGRVEQLPPARAEIEHDGLELPVQRGLVGHAHRGHALAVAGVAAERGVEVRVAAQAQAGPASGRRSPG